jgi:hypothetical protein
MIDKDIRPLWNPAGVESIEPAGIEAYLARLLEGELDFRVQDCCL